MTAIAKISELCKQVLQKFATFVNSIIPFMKKTIAIIAPLIDSSQFNLDYSLRLKKSKRDLSLAAFYEMANDGFNTNHSLRIQSHEEDIPSAGYYLQGVLRQNGYDTILTNKYDTQTLKELARRDLFAVCISTTMIITSESFILLLISIRKELPGVAIIAGGVFLWKHYMQYKRHLQSPEVFPLYKEIFFHPSNAQNEADVLIVAKHGISSFLSVLSELDNGSKKSYDHIPNLCLPGTNGFTFTKRVTEEVNFNDDFTRWDMMDEMPLKIPLRTSVGCPYRCGFCDFCQIYPQIFFRSSESLRKELNLIKNRLKGNVALIHVTDDNVFINSNRLFDVCQVFSESGLANWVGFMRGGEYTEQELLAIQRSGLRMGMIGVESGDQDQLDRMNKHQKAYKVKRGIEQLDAIGINVLMTFVVGYPGENEITLANTINFLNDLKLTNLSASYQVYPLLIQSLAELAQPDVREKWHIEGFMDHWSHYSMNSSEALTACHNVFRRVTNIPYNYLDESQFFNRGMFDYQTRKELFSLRHLLSTKYMDAAPFEETEPILRRMVSLMDLSTEGIEKLKGEIYLPTGG